MANGNATQPERGWGDVLYDPFVQQKLLLALAILLLSIAFGYLVRYSMSWYAKKVATRTRSPVDDFIMAAVHPPAVFIALAVGFWFAFREAASVLPLTFFVRTEIFFFVVLVLLISYTVGRLIQAALKYGAERKPNFRSVTQIGTRLGYLLAFAVGLMIMLHELGVQITPLLTSLGIAGLAVALALQDTLANLFAGLWIQSSRIVRPGDYVRVEDINQEGWVVDVSWRTTRLRTLPNNIIAIPNKRLADSVVSNFDMPVGDQAVWVDVGASYGSDPEQVEKVLLEVGRKAQQEIPAVVKTFEPLIRFRQYGDSSLDFRLIIRVHHYTDQYAALHQMRKMVYRAFKEAGIEIPFPHRTLYLRQDNEEGPLRLRIGGDGAGEEPSEPARKPYEAGAE